MKVNKFPIIYRDTEHLVEIRDEKVLYGAVDVLVFRAYVELEEKTFFTRKKKKKLVCEFQEVSSKAAKAAKVDLIKFSKDCLIEHYKKIDSENKRRIDEEQALKDFSNWDGIV